LTTQDVNSDALRGFVGWGKKDRYLSLTLHKLLEVLGRHLTLTNDMIQTAYTLTYVTNHGTEIDNLALLPARQSLLNVEVKEAEHRANEPQEKKVQRFRKLSKEALKQLRKRKSYITSLHADIFKDKQWRYVSVIAVPSASQCDFPDFCDYCRRYILTDDVIPRDARGALGAGLLADWLNARLGHPRSAVPQADMAAYEELATRLLGQYKLGADCRPQAGPIQQFPTLIPRLKQSEALGVSDLNLDDELYNQLAAQSLPVLDLHPQQEALVGCKNKKVLMLDDHGTGKTVVTKAKCRSLSAEGRKVFYLALVSVNYLYGKPWKQDSIFEIISRWHFQKTDITFVTMADVLKCLVSAGMTVEGRGVYDLVEEWVAGLVRGDPDVSIFVDEMGIQRKNIDRAFTCIDRIMSLCSQYVWVVGKRVGAFSDSENTDYVSWVNRLVNNHDILQPHLSTNLRTSASVTEVVQKVAAGDTGSTYKHPHPAAPCCAASGQPLIAIHAPRGWEDTDVLRRAIDKGMEKLNIKPLNTSSCDMEDSLTAFMSRGGILVTDEKVFSGAEATHVMYVSGQYSAARSRDGPLRTVSNMVYIDVDSDGYLYNAYLSAGATDGGVIH